MHTNGQITIPAGIRKALHLRTGDKLDVRVSKGLIVLTPLGKDPYRKRVVLSRGSRRR
jgi:AbrB family looped-hinge helix DNA binding protein